MWLMIRDERFETGLLGGVTAPAACKLTAIAASKTVIKVAFIIIEIIVDQRFRGVLM